MILRKAKATEIDTVMKILAEGRAAIGALGIDQWQRGYPQLEVVKADIERGESFVLEDDTGELIGSCMLTVNPDPTYEKIYDGEWLTEDEKYLTIHRIALSDNARGKGGATFVVSEAEKMARESGCGSIRIDTHLGNARMRRFLEKQGFDECGIILLSDPAEPTPERVAYEKLV